VKTLIRGIGLAMLGVCLMGLTGCGTDNESDADKLQAKSGPVPKAAEGSTKELPTAPKDMSEYAERQQKNNPYGTSKYPGAPKAK
jgi:hypothetical protein